MHAEHAPAPCRTREVPPPKPRERGVRAVLVLTAAMMVVEIIAGYATGSMGLLADGWHMATHVGAFGIASIGYVLSRRLAGHEAFGFGTGKIPTLAGYTSAIGLGFLSVFMIVEASGRLASPTAIDFAGALPVAMLGLLVNLASVWLLHDDEDHEDDHHHDHNHRAAVMHVLADAMTSALAIAALCAGRYLGWTRLDPVAGIVGALVILKWAYDLCRHAALELVDVAPVSGVHARIRTRLETLDDVRVTDLHVWPVGRGAHGCIVSLTTSLPREPAEYRAHILAACELAHLTVEVQRCGGTHEHQESA